MIFFCMLQREQEYAEARLRILGEARSPEEAPALPSASNAIEGCVLIFF
jgi:hypothetical protein